MAKKYGFHRTAHCGEAQGPWSIWEAIEELDIERIDHGVQAIYDEKLMTYLAERKLPLALCPTINIVPDIFPSIEEHPIKKLMDKGITLTVNSDDPAYIAGNLISEYKKVVDVFGLSYDDVVNLMRNSYQISFAGKGYQEQFENWLATN